MHYIRIKNWEKHQHYKDRNPPWIKLHRELLTSQTWVMLDDASRVLAIACMLLASGTENLTPANPSYIKRVAYLDYEPDLAPLVETDFIEIIDENGEVVEDASNPLAKCYPRGETEAEESRGEYLGQGKDSPEVVDTPKRGAA